MKKYIFAAPVLAVCMLLLARADEAAGLEGVSVGDATMAEEAGSVDVPEGVRVIRDVPYGTDALQRFDVYLPEKMPSSMPAPVIFMVHGGGWRRGDKGMAGVVENKVARWVPKGFIFISTNYRLLPDADPLTQAEDVAKAIAAAQRLAPRWGGHSSKFILMGHSAGAHLVDLLSAAPWRAYGEGASPWLGTVSLDSGGINVVDIMETPHLPLYDDAFGTDPSYWRKVSPYHVLTAGAPPFMLVCSTSRDRECRDSLKFSLKAKTLGVRAEILPEEMTHGEINHLLGLESDYTLDVEEFMASLDWLVKLHLKP